MTALASRGVGLGAQAGEPDEPQNAEDEEEDGDERGVVHWNGYVIGG